MDRCLTMNRSLSQSHVKDTVRFEISMYNGLCMEVTEKRKNNNNKQQTMQQSTHMLRDVMISWCYERVCHGRIYSTVYIHDFFIKEHLRQKLLCKAYLDLVCLSLG